MKTFDELTEELSVGSGAVPLGPDDLAIKKKKKKKKKKRVYDFESVEEDMGVVPKDQDLDIDIDAPNKGRLVRRKDMKKMNLLHDDKEGK